MKTIKQWLFKIFEEELPAYYETEAIRSSQVQMAFDIGSFLHSSNTKKIMMIEAPVGTGKSLGALIPSLVNTKTNVFDKKKIVYATATINLQGQLMNSEVPLLKHLSLLKSPIQAMGKSHYYCHDRFLHNSAKFSPKDQDILRKYFTNSTTGSRNELENDLGLELPEKDWKKVELKATKRECSFCRFSHSCSTNNQRNNFNSPINDLIVTNHNQYIVSTLNILSENQREPIVPVKPGILIIDEAHHFIDNFLGIMEESFTLKNLKSLQRHLLDEHKERFLEYTKKMERIFKKEIQTLGEDDSLQGRYPIPKEIINILGNILKIINDTINKRETLSTFRPYSQVKGAGKLDDWMFLLSNILNKKYVKWCEFDELKISAISNSFPSDFRRMMKFISQHNKVIVMSGTLTSNGDFESLMNQWRLKESEVLTKDFDTPFDYKNQALIYVPKNVLDPRNEGFIKSGIEIIKNLIRLTNGRMLVLSTSIDHMSNIGRSISSVLKELEIKLLLQGERSVEGLTKHFKDDEKSVLVGTGSFFSGFSIPGRSLTSVALTKLPFPVKDDPFLKLIGQGYEEKFFDFIVYPSMINKLNQAAGRLIRSIDDYGIFTILDSRIYTENYGKQIREMFSNLGYSMTQSWEVVEKFYEDMLESGSKADYQSYSRNLIMVDDCLNSPIEVSKGNVSRTKKVKKTSQANKTKGQGVTKKQRTFVNQLCERENINRIKSNKVVDLYIQLIDCFYYEWRDDVIEFIRDNFPFRNEKEKDDLIYKEGNNRKTVMPLCSKFGCKGGCLSKDTISNYLNEKYQPDEIRFFKYESHCRILLEPTTILENMEFKPNE